VAVVTGVASGIGQAIAYVFASNGNMVLATDLDEAGLRATISTIRGGGVMLKGFKST
jgi:NADP-dependent 3-hydroxy acid dehydrogenase YdfG